MAKTDLQGQVAELTADLASLSAELTRMHVDVQGLERDIETARATEPASVIEAAKIRLAAIKRRLTATSRKQAEIELRLANATGRPRRLN